MVPYNYSSSIVLNTALFFPIMTVWKSYIALSRQDIGSLVLQAGLPLLQQEFGMRQEPLQKPQCAERRCFILRFLPGLQQGERSMSVRFCRMRRDRLESWGKKSGAPRVLHGLFLPLLCAPLFLFQFPGLSPILKALLTWLISKIGRAHV